MQNPNPQILKAVGEARLAGGSIQALAEAAGISKNSASRYLNYWESLQPPELVKELREKLQSNLKLGRTEDSEAKGSKSYFQRRSKELWEENQKLKSQLLSGNSSLPPIAEGLNSTRIGYLAEYLVRYRVVRAGLGIFNPEFQAEACDLLVASPSDKSKFYRCEVKATSKSGPVVISKPRFGGQYLYRKEDGLDFFFLVDLLTEVVCVVPFEHIEGKSNLTIAPGNLAWNYKDRFDLFK